MDVLARAGEAISSCADTSVWALSEEDLLAALDAVHVLEQRLVAVKLALVREVDGRAVAGGHGASSTAVWLRDRLRVGAGAARRTVGLAAALDVGPAVVAQALARGVVGVEQARVITDVTAALPASAGVEVVDKAAQVLVDAAVDFEPGALRRLGERVLFHVAPQIAEQAELAALTAAEARAHDRRHVTLSSPGSDGQVRLTGRLDAESAAVVRAALDPISGPSGVGDDRSPGQRRADALADVCRLALHTGALPDNGGDRPQVVVTVDLDTLRERVGTATLDGGERLTPETVRRVACDAQVLPAVLDGAGQVLDLGRQRRLFTGPLRRALVLRDGGCAFPGCDRPPRWSDGHHIVHWADGGQTCLTNAVLLCRYHHRVVHHDGWQVRLAADGLPEFLPPAWLDPTGQPRRNHYHRRC
ncbi:HNH endonuclease signature motif containing protein [Micromonospora zhanjiangensis]|uniref:DUF222 domain-containing protein n=1 Tax=Micromonospora zhanjiangensis TaxID=1522057 RepID=A0ABV8KLS8_9ACTN